MNNSRHRRPFVLLAALVTACAGHEQPTAAAGSSPDATSGGANSAGSTAGRPAANGGMSGAPHAGTSGQAGSSVGAGAGAGVVPAAGQGGSGGRAGSPAVHSGALRIMPLGDSITETTCGTLLLWKKLRDGGHTNFDFVGTRQNQQSCGVTNPDRDCEGHSGYLVIDLVGTAKNASELTPWCTADRGEVVLMHFGTNDVWNAVAPNAILNAFSVVVDALRAAQPNAIIFVAQIIPMNPSGCAECAARVQALNSQIPGWASGKNTPGSPIYVVDQWTGFDAAADTGDGVHPNMQGAQKMADRWSAALIEHGVF